MSSELIQPDATGLSRRSMLVGSAGFAALAFGLTACTSSSSAKGGVAPGFGPTTYTGGPPPGGTPVRGGTLRIGSITGGPSETLSVLTALSNADIMRIYNLYDPLFFPAPGGLVAPALVEVAEPNADATVWTFKLRKGVTWHDGKPFTADDVVYTIQKSWANSKNTFNAVLVTLVDFAGVKKIDDFTVQVPLKVGVAQFPSITCIQQCYVVQAGTTDFANGNGTGPFKLKSFTPGSRSEFTANPNYWISGQPYVDTLVIDSSYAQQQTMLNALLAGQLDIIPQVPATLAVANARSGKIVLGNQLGPGWVGMACRADKGTFADPQVRKAFKLIPKRPQYVSTAYNGFGAVSNDLSGFTNQFFADDLKRDQDLAQAKSLLKAAGKSDLTITLNTSPVWPGQLEISQLFKEQAKGAGVNVELKPWSTSDYFTPAAGFFEREFGTTYFNTGVNSLAAFYTTALLPGGPYNETHWDQKDANALLYDALRETDQAKAAVKWHAVQAQQFDSGPYIIPATFNWIDAYAPKVRGVQTTSVLSTGNFDFTGAWFAK